MNALEEIQIEQYEVRQTDPVVKEIEALGFKVTGTRSYRHDVTADHRGNVITVAIDDLCLTREQLETIMTIGFEWISSSRHGLEICVWRREN